jgi:hypothetical protein
MLPLRLAQTQLQTTQKGEKFGRMLYNEFEQWDSISAVRFGLALLAYADILLYSMWAMHRIRQTPGLIKIRLCYPDIRMRRQVLKASLPPLRDRNVSILGGILNNRTFPSPKFVYEGI